MRLAERQLGHRTIQHAAVRCARRGLQEKHRVPDDRGGRIHVWFPISRHTIRHVITLLRIFHHIMMRYRPSIRLDQAKILSSRSQLEIRVQLFTGGSPVFTGRKHQQETAGLHLHRWQLPTSQILDVIRQRPTGEINRFTASVVNLDPVGTIVVGVLQPLVVNREKFANDHPRLRLAKRQGEQTNKRHQNDFNSCHNRDNTSLKKESFT